MQFVAPVFKISWMGLWITLILIIVIIFFILANSYLQLLLYCTKSIMLLLCTSKRKKIQTIFWLCLSCKVPTDDCFAELLLGVSTLLLSWSESRTRIWNFDDLGISLPVFPTRTNLKLRIISVTLKMVKKAITNLIRQRCLVLIPVHWWF